jgi:hypothetical protein
MNKLLKASGIYALVSAFAIGVVWTILLGCGFIREEISAHPIQYYFLFGAEALTACMLFVSALGLLGKSGKGIKSFYIAMGMLLYAVIFAAGKFLSLGLLYFAVLFMAVAIATSVFLGIHICKK